MSEGPPPRPVLGDLASSDPKTEFLAYLDQKTVYPEVGAWEESDEEPEATENAAAPDRKRLRSKTANTDTANEPRRKSAKSPATAGGKVRGIPNTDRKSAEKMEDASWIAAQATAAVSRPAAGDGAEMQPWCEAISCSADQWLQMRREEAEGRLVVPMFCMSRIWGGGWGGQCTVPREAGSELCRAHEKQLTRQGYLTHGRIDGPIPPKKRKEYEMWQAKLQREGAQKGCDAGTAATMNDGDSFSEARWRAMGPGAGESARAYSYRTGGSPANQKPGTAASRRKRSAP